MPTPFLPEVDLSSAVETALEKAGAITVSGEFVQSLENYGINNDFLAQQLAALIQSAKDPIKFKAILAALNARGIDLEPKQNGTSVPNIQFNIVANEANLNTLFSPRR